MGTALVGTVDDMEFLGEEEIEELDGYNGSCCNDVIHALSFKMFRSAKVQLFFCVYGFFCIFAEEINIYKSRIRHITQWNSATY